MKQKLKAWFEAWLTAAAADESDAGREQEIMIPVSQRYGLELYPLIHRYHEK
ncbi:hypothetical protein O3W44_01885 [Pantoea sp. LMR881]|uniref:hypothetical protein n=1 Tax=Pantoea sp. LMR881 TaxID=3014336 RepID=UPI0022B01348|nr:hypothetical protein [Pantoea sp. LMR881]MCZ4058104.1 hypothetical protein [Pantoea sp. LMR881]